MAFESQEPVWGHVETPDITDEGVASTHSVAGRRNQSQELDDDTPSSFEADVDATRESWVQRLHTATRQFIGFLRFRKQAKRRKQNQGSVIFERRHRGGSVGNDRRCSSSASGCFERDRSARREKTQCFAGKLK